MTDTRPKHKPNEKHTLDEVLKSLQDLVRGDVLTKPAARPAPSAKPAAAAPRADMGDIIRSLEHLLESDLKVDEKPKAPAKAPTPPPTQVRQVPKAAPRPAPVAPAPKPAPPAAPPPPPPPLLDTEEELEIEMESQPAVEPLAFPEEMSDGDIAKALADIQIDMDAARALEAELETIEAAPAPELEPVTVKETPTTAKKSAPPLKLAIVQPPTEIAQHELTLEEPSPATVNLADKDSDLALEEETPDVIDEEIVAAPPPAETPPAQDYESIDFSSETPAEEIVMEAAPSFAADDDFMVAFTPSARKEKPKTETPEPEDLAPPPSTDDGDYFDLAEPTTPSAGTSTGSLGESIELDVGITGESSESSPTVELGALSDLAPVPTTEIIETVEPTPEPAASTPAKEIPVLKDIAVVPAAAPAQPPPAESFTLELTPVVSPRPVASAQDLHQMAVRVIAKLNIELRKAGKAPLDVKTINRLQQLLKEALEKK